MHVRLARHEDVESIRSVGLRTWPSTYAFAGEEYIAHGLRTWWSLEALHRSLETTTCLVAEHGGELVGLGNIDLRGETPIIWKLYVVPEAQGSGVGSALMDGLLACVRAGPTSVRLEYLAGNDRAARFYAAKQFNEVGRDPSENSGWPELVWVQRDLQVAGPDDC